MTPGLIRLEIVTERAFWVRQMVNALRTLPLDDLEAFTAERHLIAAAESYLRRALEALMDLGRHILAKGFGYPATEYKEVARALREKGVLGTEAAEIMDQMAGYRNRMVHFYHEIQPDELYEICHSHLDDFEMVLGELLLWVKEAGTDH